MADATGTENSILMQQARETLDGRWSLAVGTFFIYFAVTVAIQYLPHIGDLVSLVLSGPMTLGLTIFCLALSRNRDPQSSQIFEGFRKFWISFGAYVLVTLFVLLWMLLLIVPGIIAALSYSMTFYIIADDGAIGPLDAIRKSKQMMYGYRWKYFCLGFRFLGWILVGVLTFGIGFLWVSPYMSISYAKFYEDLLILKGVVEKDASETP
jgi:uncharacterized membrane protein